MLNFINSIVLIKNSIIFVKEIITKKITIMGTNKKMHFRINTPGLLKETLSCALKGNQPEIKISFKFLINYLGQVGIRCAELNDPVLNRLMFDMNLYELPLPNTPEFEKIMNQVYEAEEQYLKNKK